VELYKEMILLDAMSSAVMLKSFHCIGKRFVQKYGKYGRKKFGKKQQICHGGELNKTF